MELTNSVGEYGATNGPITATATTDEADAEADLAAPAPRRGGEHREPLAAAQARARAAPRARRWVPAGVAAARLHERGSRRRGDASSATTSVRMFMNT